MGGYYTEKLSAERLREVYAIGSPAVQAYLQGEIDFVRERMRPGDRILELGCGYGRVLEALASGGVRGAGSAGCAVENSAPTGSSLWGIDTSLASLKLARRSPGTAGVRLATMDAGRLGLRDSVFDLVACIQNGISSFAIDPLALMREAVRVTRAGGQVLFSSYAARFWPHRLAWFGAQAARGLLGEIDDQATGDGVIVCKDGFRATTLTPEDFRRLAGALSTLAEIREVADSSLFCILSVD